MACRTCGGKGWYFWTDNQIRDCERCETDQGTIMDFRAYQLQASETALYEDDFYPIASLMVEAAELSDLFVKPMLRGDKTWPSEEKIISEAGDVLWNLAMILSDCGIDLQDVAEYNLSKLKRRSENGTIQGSGDR